MRAGKHCWSAETSGAFQTRQTPESLPATGACALARPPCLPRSLGRCVSSLYGQQVALRAAGGVISCGQVFAIDLSGVRPSGSRQLRSVEGMLIGTAEQQKQGSINFAGQTQMSELSSGRGDQAVCHHNSRDCRKRMRAALLERWEGPNVRFDVWSTPASVH